MGLALVIWNVCSVFWSIFFLSSWTYLDGPVPCAVPSGLFFALLDAIPCVYVRECVHAGGG